MTILISGAGVAGLTTAYWLEKYGFQTTIVERAPTLLTGGYKIDVRGAALGVLRQMGIYDAVFDAGTHMKKGILVDKKGKIINEMSGDAFGHRVDDDLEIIRGVLCQILMDQLTKTEFIFADSIKAITPSAHGVNVEFQKNKPREFDLVIGADGIHSNVRQLVFGNEKNFLHELGLYLSVFTIPNYLDLDRVEMQYSEIGKIALVWSARGEPNMKACFGFSAPKTDVDLHNKANQQQLLQTHYADFGWEVPRLLKMMPDAIDFYFDAAALIQMERWSSDRVVLVGDAGYCASPMSGQGTSLALIGAYILAGELASAKGNHKLAFENYEKELRSFVHVNQQLGKTAAKIMQANGKTNLLTSLLQKLMKVMPGFLIKFLINLSTRRIKKAANAITLKHYEVTIT